MALDGKKLTERGIWIYKLNELAGENTQYLSICAVVAEVEASYTENRQTGQEDHTTNLSVQALADSTNHSSKLSENSTHKIV